MTTAVRWVLEPCKAAEAALPEGTSSGLGTSGRSFVRLAALLLGSQASRGAAFQVIQPHALPLLERTCAWFHARHTRTNFPSRPSDRIADRHASASLARRRSGLRAEVVSTVPDQQEFTEEDRQEGFQWRRHWYPMAIMRDLEAMDPRQPYPVKLLGEDIVLWKEPKSGEWKAFVDRCPHRWAPLSEGRVDQESGRLHCVYHGWEFEGDGSCGQIPLANEVVEKNAKDSRRACATVIPTKVFEDKLWLWPDTSPDGLEASKLASPATIESIGDPDFGGEWYYRDLFYGYDTLLENLSDPAHVPFAHHGVMSNRAAGSAPMDITMEKGLGPDMYRTMPTGYNGARNLVIGFEAPCLLYYESDYSEAFEIALSSAGKFLKTLVFLVNAFKLDKRLSMKAEDRKNPSDRLLLYLFGYAVPTAPGRCRVFLRGSRNFLFQHPVIPRKWRNSLAGHHLLQNKVLEGDSYLLHMQEHALLAAGKHGLPEPERTFYLPASTDAPVRAFRRWFNTRAGGAISWAKGVDPLALGPILSREEVLGRFEAHTKHCSACSKAYRVSNHAKRIAAGAAIVLLAAAAAVPRGGLALCLAGSSVASSGLSVMMARRAQQFVFVDYVHAVRD